MLHSGDWLNSLFTAPLSTMSTFGWWRNQLNLICRISCNIMNRELIENVVSKMQILPWPVRSYWILITWPDSVYNFCLYILLQIMIHIQILNFQSRYYNNSTCTVVSLSQRYSPTPYCSQCHLSINFFYFWESLSNWQCYTYPHFSPYQENLKKFQYLKWRHEV